ncbi:MAG: GNAT family N-acetyltransferase, partial [Ardenticatenales bacterium]|nr:GNAT family N-acetyltransferase [Ardenticatenales bacterium]
MRETIMVSLQEITAETVRAICNLNVAEHQRHFVAPNAISIAQAYFEPKAWFRAVYSDDTPVGFAMLYEDPEEAEYHLWRFMIDAAHQGKGYGVEALRQIIAHVKEKPGATRLTLDYVPGPGTPQPFYERLGFQP